MMAPWWQCLTWGSSWRLHGWQACRVQGLVAGQPRRLLPGPAQGLLQPLQVQRPVRAQLPALWAQRVARVLPA